MNSIRIGKTLSLIALCAAACAKKGEAPAPSVAAGDAPTEAAPAPEPAYMQPGATGAGGPDVAEAEEESFAGGDADEAAPAAIARSDRPAEKRAEGPRSAPIASQAARVKAGEWDDNANYREFQKYAASHRRGGVRKLDVRNRRFLVVRDSQGRGVPGCSIEVVDHHQHRTKLTTTASGRAILFPHAEGLHGPTLAATTRCQGTTARASFQIEKGDDSVTLDLPVARRLPRTRTIDLAFVLDTTGSMSEEIRAVKDTIRTVASTLDGGTVDVRIGLVEYKDRSDAYVTKTFDFSRDLRGFQRKVSRLSATGGGDTPESANEGLHVALTKLSWSKSSVGRFAFLIGDAPPHLDYQDDVGYDVSSRRAARNGIQVFTVAASGMNDVGQMVWRQIAQYTGATNLFVLRGGAGPQSVGGGDPTSSCGGTQTGYTSGNLDQLVVGKIKNELAGLDRNPLLIAGLGMDEKAKPCEDRLVLAR